MNNFTGTVSRLGLTTFLVFGAMSAASTFAQDLSKYRNFQLGMELPAAAKQAEADLSQVKLIHSRPALIQELAWHPQPFNSPSQPESVKEAVFTFYDGVLFRITVDYDRYQTAGLTTADMIEALSAHYGTAGKPTGTVDVAPALYGEAQEVLAEWHDSDYRFDLIRGSYGPVFRLVGVLKRLETPFRVASVEAARLDEKEAPQREAARVAKESAADQVVLDQARLANKPKFRP
jgi:hypothetical protein